ncbi:helix-turn-helix protein [Kushneria sinocarnis]|uniref:Helix-turn-helix protein n=1 Tax=Kushneria sinocarnis TaxID=595502 RepID=A0A420WY16_9GAMM|nr:AraC family transcriptional regulator [Kushneria sinocarnis]RKR06114.1 helix-turn-helix protein [Kushneria sinocarnis]
MDCREFDVAATEVILHEHTNELMPMTMVARQVGLSTSHLRRKFKQSFGVTPTDYHATIRLDRAAMLLIYTRKSIMEVALECGYQDHAAFSRVFRRHFDLSPRAYREQMRNTLSALPRVPDATPHVEVRENEEEYYLVIRDFGDSGLSEESLRQHLLTLCPQRAKESILESVCFLYDDPRVTPAHRVRKDIGYRMARRETWHPPLPLRWVTVPAGRCMSTRLNSWKDYEAAFQHMALNWAMMNDEQVRVDHSRVLYREGRRDAGLSSMELLVPVE